MMDDGEIDLMSAKIGAWRGKSEGVEAGLSWSGT